MTRDFAEVFVERKCGGGLWLNPPLRSEMWQSAGLENASEVDMAEGPPKPQVFRLRDGADVALSP